MAAYILVSGAWHGAWCWERVVPLLAAAGHVVHAPDLAGMGDDPTPLAEVSLALWADQVAALVAAQPEPAILVGHSRGGIVISEAAERVPERIATLVYLAAFLVPAGDTLLVTAARNPADAEAATLVPHDDGTATIKPEAVAPTFYNRTDPDWVARAAARLTPEPMAALTLPLALTPERFGRVPRAYIECVHDRAVPLALQRAMQEALPCDPVFTLESDHSPFYSNPAGLADSLLALAARTRG